LRISVIILVYIFFLCSKQAYAQLPYQSLLFKSYGQRAAILLNFYNKTVKGTDSVAIFRQIDSVRQLALKEKDRDLSLEADLMSAHYFYYRDTIFSRSLITDMLESLKRKGIDEKAIWLEAMAENMLALYNFTTKHYEPGFVHQQRVYHLIKDIDPDAFPHKQNCLLQMAMEHYRFKDFTETIFYIQEALKAQPKEKMSFAAVRPTLLNTIGLVYQKKGQLDSADYYFNQIIHEASSSRDSVWLCIAGGNLGYSYFLRKEFNKAIPLLEQDVAFAVEQGDFGLASGSQMVLGAISLEEKVFHKAWEQLQRARIFVSLSKQFNRKETLYPLLAKLYAYRGMPEIADIYFDSAIIVKDSLARAFNSLQLLRARQKVQMEQYNAEMASISNRQKINVLERNILMAIVLLLMIASVLIYREQKRKNRLQQEKAIKANEELSYATKQLSDFSKNISEKNALIDILQEQQGNATTTVLNQLQKSTILTDDDWDYFRGLFEKVHAGFLHRLKEKIPGLTPAETRFLVLTKLGLSGKEMAAILGIGNDAIRQIRSRVRKKLNFTEDVNIEAFIAAI
jgi:tetratricopeptide (TPR) repeat protein/DNA-binding CsgD family transcriptional regulator